MLSLSKLILLIFVVLAVMFGWRWFRRVEAIGRARLDRERGGGGGVNGAGTGAGPGAGSAPSSAPRAKAAQDLEKCADCGAYVVPDAATPCGRRGCPY